MTAIEAMLEDLGAQAAERVRELLRQAYDRGFREALATAGQPEATATGSTGASAAVSVATPAAVVVPAQATEAALRTVAWTDGGGADESVDGDGEPDVRARGPEAFRIRASATVDGLHARIVRDFGLERFEIDVVLCKDGDPDRRRLKGSTRLSHYAKVK